MPANFHELKSYIESPDKTAHVHIFSMDTEEFKNAVIRILGGLDSREISSLESLLADRYDYHFDQHEANGKGGKSLVVHHSQGNITSTGSYRRKDGRSYDDIVLNQEVAAKRTTSDRDNHISDALDLVRVQKEKLTLCDGFRNSDLTSATAIDTYFDSKISGPLPMNLVTQAFFENVEEGKLSLYVSAEDYTSFMSGTNFDISQIKGVASVPSNTTGRKKLEGPNLSICLQNSLNEAYSKYLVYDLGLKIRKPIATKPSALTPVVESAEAKETETDTIRKNAREFLMKIWKEQDLREVCFPGLSAEAMSLGNTERDQHLGEEIEKALMIKVDEAYIKSKGGLSFFSNCNNRVTELDLIPLTTYVDLVEVLEECVSRELTRNFETRAGGGIEMRKNKNRYLGAQQLGIATQADKATADTMYGTKTGNVLGEGTKKVFEVTTRMTQVFSSKKTSLEIQLENKVDTRANTTLQEVMTPIEPNSEYNKGARETLVTTTNVTDYSLTLSKDGNHNFSYTFNNKSGSSEKKDISFKAKNYEGVCKDIQTNADLSDTQKSYISFLYLKSMRNSLLQKYQMQALKDEKQVEILHFKGFHNGLNGDDTEFLKILQKSPELAHHAVRVMQEKLDEMMLGEHGLAVQQHNGIKKSFGSHNFKKFGGFGLPNIIGKAIEDNVLYESTMGTNGKKQYKKDKIIALPTTESLSYFELPRYDTQDRNEKWIYLKDSSGPRILKITGNNSGPFSVEGKEVYTSLGDCFQKSSYPSKEELHAKFFEQLTIQALKDGTKTKQIIVPILDKDGETVMCELALDRSGNIESNLVTTPVTKSIAFHNIRKVSCNGNIDRASFAHIFAKPEYGVALLKALETNLIGG